MNQWEGRARVEGQPVCASHGFGARRGSLRWREPVSFGTEDGATLKGHFYSSPGAKRRVVVFAHEATKDQVLSLIILGGGAGDEAAAEATTTDVSEAHHDGI